MIFTRYKGRQSNGEQKQKNENVHTGGEKSGDDVLLSDTQSVNIRRSHDDAQDNSTWKAKTASSLCWKALLLFLLMLRKQGKTETTIKVLNMLQKAGEKSRSGHLLDNIIEH